MKKIVILAVIAVIAIVGVTVVVENKSPQEGTPKERMPEGFFDQEIHHSSGEGY